MIAALRYNDSFVKTNGEWLYAERLLYVGYEGLGYRYEAEALGAKAI